MYLDYNHIQTATGRINLFYCGSINITIGHMCTYIDRNRIEIATTCISLYFLGLYQCYHEAYRYKY